MNANLVKRSTDDLIAENPTDALRQFELEPPVTEIREPAGLLDAEEIRGVLDGLKIFGLA